MDKENTQRAGGIQGITNDDAKTKEQHKRGLRKAIRMQWCTLRWGKAEARTEDGVRPDVHALLLRSPMDHIMSRSFALTRARLIW